MKSTSRYGRAYPIDPVQPPSDTLHRADEGRRYAHTGGTANAAPTQGGESNIAGDGVRMALERAWEMLCEALRIVFRVRGDGETFTPLEILIKYAFIALFCLFLFFVGTRLFSKASSGTPRRGRVSTSS